MAPLATRSVWKKWCQIAFPEATFLAIEGETYEYKVSDIYFIHYDILYNQLPLISKLGSVKTMVFDEIHLLSKRSPKRAQATTFASGFAKERIGLTGTPLWNKLDGLYPMLKIVRGGAEWGSYSEFTQKYCGASVGEYGWQIGETTHAEALDLRKRLDEFSIRRTWKEVSEELPEIKRRAVIVPISRELSVELDTETFDEGAVNTIGFSAKLRAKLGKQKVDKTVEIVRSYDEPTIVWFWHKIVGKRISDQADGFYIDGSVSGNKRDQVIEEWSDSKKPLVISIGVGQVGIDLSHAEVDVVCEYDYTPAVMGQADMRKFSPNAKRLETVYVAADHYMEKKVLGTIAKKCSESFKLGISASDVDLSELISVFSDPTTGDLDRLLASL